MRLLLGPWPARVTWAVLPLLVGPALGAALERHSSAVATTGSVLAWAAWAGVLVAVLLPSTASLTGLRIAAPVALVTANWAALRGDDAALGAAAVAGAAVAVVVALSPLTGDCFVNASSYGDERRLPLRVPGALLFGPVPLAEVAAVLAPIGGPLLLASGQWWLGGGLLVVGLPGSWVAVRALHGLSRRWVVLVPAGLVLHDAHTLMDPVLFPRARIRRLGPAPASPPDEALDLTARAFGLALRLDLDEPLAVAPRRPGQPLAVVEVASVLFTPTRPGEVVREAGRRRISLG